MTDAKTVCVPVEPTPEMIAAACAEGLDNPLRKYLTPEERGGPAIFPLATWRAMVAAAPSDAVGDVVTVSRPHLKYTLSHALWKLDEGKVTEARVLLVSAQDIVTAATNLRQEAPAHPVSPSEGEAGWNGLGEPPVGNGRVEIGAGDPIYQAFKPSREAIEAVEKNEVANAQALHAIRSMMAGHVTNWPDPKRFGTALSLIDKTLHSASPPAETGEGCSICKGVGKVRVTGSPVGDASVRCPAECAQPVSPSEAWSQERHDYDALTTIAAHLRESPAHPFSGRQSEEFVLAARDAHPSDTERMRAALERIADPRNIHFAGDAQVVARAALEGTGR